MYNASIKVSIAELTRMGMVRSCFRAIQCQRWLVPYANEYKQKHAPTFSPDVVDVKKQDQDIVSRLMCSFHSGLVRGKLPE